MIVPERSLVTIVIGETLIMVTFIRSDLDFILQQILITERNAAGMSLLDLFPNIQVPFGLRTVDGSYNNLVFNENLGIDQTHFGVADAVFFYLLTSSFSVADSVPVGFFGPDNPTI